MQTVIISKMMRPKWILLTLFILTIFYLDAQEPFECKGQYYLSLTKTGSRSSGLYRVRIAQDGSSVFLDTISSSIGLVINAMGYRITDNFIYGMDPNTAMLRKVGKDGIAIDLGIPKDIPRGIQYYAGDVTPDGKFLILIGLSGNNPQIVKVDLESPDYQCSFVRLQLTSPSILDIAFDPYTGIMYGHDSGRKKIVTINPDNGQVDLNYLVQPQVDQLGALFFDSFGNLFGYGAYGTTIQDKFVAVDKATGKITLIGSGPVSTGQDGCACPYTIGLQKIVTPDTAYTCSEVVYSFILSNLSGARRSSIYFEDVMPDVLTIKKILSNPFGGEILLNKSSIRIDNMNVNVGIDTLKVLVSIDNNASGLYSNQAILGGLPLSLGSLTVSDNPLTFQEKDSTQLYVISVDLDYLNKEIISCKGDSVRVDLPEYGYKLVWSDGDTSNSKLLESPGSYPLMVSNACGLSSFMVKVLSHELEVKILEDTVTIELGKLVDLHSIVYSENKDIQFRWFSKGQNPDVDCITCQNTNANAVVNGYYYLNVTDGYGCVSMDSVYVRVVWNAEIFAPNIITANHDGRNDVFYLSGNPLATFGNYLAVYDRWGNKVYETSNFRLNDPAYGWDGKFLGRSVVNGVYSWLAEIKYIDDTKKIFKGDITVIK